MSDRELHSRIAHLEFVNDQLSAELSYVDELLQLIGFPEGLLTVKVAALEILEEQEAED